MPLNTAGSLTVPPHDPMTGPSAGGADPFPGVSALGSSGIAAGNDPLESAIQSEINSNAPKTASVMQETKFGKLLKIVGPILEGGLVGGFSGRGHIGGGFGATQDFYAARRQQQLQQAMLQQQIQNNQAKNALEAAKTQREIDRPNISRTNPPIKVLDDNPDSPTFGKRFYFAQDTDTGKWARVPGGAVPDEDKGHHFQMTNQGLIAADNETGTAKRVTLDDSDSAPASAGAPAGPPQSTGVVQFGGQTSPMFIPRKPGATDQSPAAIRTGGAKGGAPSGGAPLMPPGYGKPQHENDFEQFYDKYLDDNGLDDTAANQLKARSAYESAGRKPEGDGSLTGAAYTKRQGQYIDQLNKGFASSEQQRQRAIDQLKKDPAALPEDQQRIEEENADRKQTLHQRIADAAASQGINVGDVPDYRAQLANGGQGGGATNVPPNTARSNGGKVAGAADVGAWARKKGISIGEARRQFRAKGYALQGSSQ